MAFMLSIAGTDPAAEQLLSERAGVKSAIQAPASA